MSPLQSGGSTRQQRQLCALLSMLLANQSTVLAALRTSDATLQGRRTLEESTAPPLASKLPPRPAKTIADLNRTLVTPLPASKRCVVVLASGCSGSSVLVDALNQLPNYLIRGDQSGTFYHVFKTYKRLLECWNHASHIKGDIHKQIKDAGFLEHEHSLLHQPSFAFVKKSYAFWAQKWKLPWYNDLHPIRSLESVRTLYTMLYGYHGPDVVSGFKEVRFGHFGNALNTRCLYHQHVKEVRYDGLEEFVHFLRSVCVDTKLLLNTRRDASPQANSKLKQLSGRFATDKDFEFTLAETHQMYDKYASEHPDHAFRVHMEDMFDAKAAPLLAKQLLTFLGEDPAVNKIEFVRRPPLPGSDPDDEDDEPTSAEEDDEDEDYDPEDFTYFDYEEGEY